MITHRFWIALLGAGLFVIPAQAQVSEKAKVELIRTIVADQAAARIAFPFGNEGVELDDAGAIDQQKLQQQLHKNGRSIEPGRIVNITDLSFAANHIELVLDGGGNNKGSWKDHVSVGMGGVEAPVTNNGRCQIDPASGVCNGKKNSGSKITLHFASKVPADLTPDQLRQFLNPVLDFAKHEHNAVDALPPQFQEAVKAKEAMIGMDHDTVILAMGRPDHKSTEKNDQGVEEETWIYEQRGYHAEFVVFIDNVVVRTKKY